MVLILPINVWRNSGSPDAIPGLDNHMLPSEMPDSMALPPGSGLRLDADRLAWQVPISALMRVLEWRSKNLTVHEMVASTWTSTSSRPEERSLLILLDRCSTDHLKAVLIHRGPYLDATQELENGKNVMPRSSPAIGQGAFDIPKKLSARSSATYDMLVFQNIHWCQSNSPSGSGMSLVSGTFRVRPDRVMAVVALPVPVKAKEGQTFESPTRALWPELKQATHGVYVFMGAPGVTSSPLVWETHGTNAADSRTQSFQLKDTIESRSSAIQRESFFLTSEFQNKGSGITLQGKSMSGVDLPEFTFKASESTVQWWPARTAGKVWINPAHVLYAFTRQRKIKIDTLQSVVVIETTVVLPDGVTFVVEGEGDGLFAKS